MKDERKENEATLLKEHNLSLFSLFLPFIPHPSSFILLFFGLLIALYSATQSRAAPLVILFITLHILAFSFAWPAAGYPAGFTPLVMVSSLLVLGFEPAFLAVGLAVLLTELLRPVLIPIWQATPVPHPSFGQRLLYYALQTGVFATAAWLYFWQGGFAPLSSSQSFSALLPPAAPWPGWWPLLTLALVYLGLELGLLWLLASWFGSGRAQASQQTWPILLFFNALNYPFALLGSFTYLSVGLPAFVMFSVGMGGMILVNWLVWQNRMVMRQQLQQLTQLNQVGSALREALDVPAVFDQSCRQIQTLVGADQIHMALMNPAGQLNPILTFPTPTQPAAADDFTNWVAQHRQVLEIDQHNLFYAQKHHLTPPTPPPAAWLGWPLQSGAQFMGVLVVQRYAPRPPFTRWERELLLAIGQMSSSALQNAQTHEQTVQLYTRTDEALARRVEQLQALLDSTHEGVLLFNPAGELLLVNQLAAEYLGQPAEMLLHRPVPLPLVNERLGYAPAELAQLWEQLQQDTPPAGRRTRFQAAGRYVERQESPVLAHTSRVMGWLVVLRDVTEEQEQLAWRTHFTNMMVHDLRNPITTLLSVLHRLSQKTEPEVQPLIQSGVHTSHHLLDMVDSLLDVNRLEAGQLLVEAEAMRLPSLVEKVVANLRPTAAEKQITLQVISPAGLPAVWADEELVRRIVVNLLDNALKFTPQGGQIMVELRPEPSTTAEPGVRCLITDTGPGIPAGDKERIFERFVRIHSGGAQVQGTGIGLSFCQLAVTAQGGRIWVEDAPQGGSCFLFTLPGIPEFPAG